MTEHITKEEIIDELEHILDYYSEMRDDDQEGLRKLLTFFSHPNYQEGYIIGEGV